MPSRDMDLLRSLLFDIEKLPYEWLTISMEGRSQADLHYHIKLASDAV